MRAATTTAAIDRPGAIAQEDQLRAQLYRLLSAVLSAPVSGDQLSALAALSGDQQPLGRAIGDLAVRAANTSVEAARDEYDALFIGLVRGELLPYASYYLTGFLHEKPLARLRQDLELVGAERADGVSEPEDHIASVLESMAGLIDGAFGEPQALADQKRFFEAHVASWAHHFFRDLEAAKSADLYVGVARVGRVFLDIESEAFRHEAV